MKKNMIFYKKIIFIAYTLLLISFPLFSKGKKDVKELPIQVQEKISTYEEKRSSWHICDYKESKGIKIVNEAIYGPFENKDQAMLVWMYFEYGQSKKYCLAKNMTFMTNNPENFYKSDYAAVKKDFLEKGKKFSFQKYFDVDITEEKPLEIHDNKDKKDEDVIVKAKIEIDSQETNPTETENQEQNIITESENINNSTTETLNTENTYIESEEDNKNSSENLENNENKNDQQAEIISENNNNNELENIEENEKVVEVEKPTFELSIKNSEESSLRVEKEFLQDYAPKKKIPLPTEDFSVIDFEIDDPNETDSNGVTLLMKAAKNGNNWELDKLINKGADVNKKDNQGWTALMYACRYQESTEIVNKLINNGASIKDKNNYLLSALNIASIYNGNPEILGLLLLRYVPSDTDVLNSLVMLLSDNSTNEFSKLAKIKIFISKKVPLNTFYNGKTPLMYAAEFGNSTKVIKLLIESGAVTTIYSTEGKTAFDYAQQNINLEHDEYYWLLNK